MLPGITRRAEDWTELADLGLIIADVPWPRFLSALRQTSDERFAAGGPEPDWQRFVAAQDVGANSFEWHMVGGAYERRSYLLANGGLVVVADRITALASATQSTVLGYSYMEIIANVMLVAARGPALLRYILETLWGNHFEGEPLAGEADPALSHTPAAFEAIARARGFEIGKWLSEGQVWRVRWTMLDPATQAEAHKRLYFGPLRMRVDHIEEAARTRGLPQED